MSSKEPLNLADAKKTDPRGRPRKAKLARVGGDEATARVFWDLGRRVRAYMSVPGLRSGPDDILAMFEDDELDDLAEQMSDP